MVIYERIKITFDLWESYSDIFTKILLRNLLAFLSNSFFTHGIKKVLSSREISELIEEK